MGKRSANDLIAQLQDPSEELKLDVEGYPLRVTSLSRVLWPASKGVPAITKRDLLLYYAQVGGFMLPHLQDRPLAFVRFPDGLEGKERFFQKHWDKGRPEFVQTVCIWSDKNKGPRDWIVCNNLATLLWLCQISSLEIHAWYSRIMPDGERPMDFSSSPESLEASVLSYPDFVVFDLDPNLKDTESTFDKPAFRKTVAVACELREYLDKLGMKAFLKTSGKTGLHLYIPIRREHPYDEVKAWAKAVGKEIESRCPEEVTMEWSLSKRPNKIFIDHNQNVRGKTLVAIYSTRPAVDAPVSFPVSWDDLEDIDPREFTMRTAPKLLQKQGDPWAGILKRPQTLKPLSKAYLG